MGAAQPTPRGAARVPSAGSLHVSLRGSSSCSRRSCSCSWVSLYLFFPFVIAKKKKAKITRFTQQSVYWPETQLFPGANPSGCKAKPILSRKKIIIIVKRRIFLGGVLVAGCAPTRVPRVSPGIPAGTGQCFASGRVPVEKSYLKQTKEPQDHRQHRRAALGLTPP